MSGTGVAVNPGTLMRPPGYSHGFLAPGGWLFVAGQLGTDVDATYPGGDDVAEQFDRALWNFLEVVRQAGGEPGHVMKMTFFVTDLDEWFAAGERLGPVYRNHFDRHYPAITLLEQPRLTIPGGKVEIEGIALVPTDQGGADGR